MLRTCPVRFAGHRVDVVGQVLPGAGDIRNHRLTAEAPFGADLARDARHFRREGAQLIHHRVQRFLQQQDFAAHIDRDLLRQIAVGDRGRHFRDVAHLAGQVGRHEVDVVGQILPGAADARHLRLTAQLAFGADLARDARHLAGERVELIDHRVDRVLQLENFTADIDRDLAAEVAARDRRRHLGDVAHLRRQIAGHRVDAVGQVLPGAGNARHLGLSAEPAFGADLARDARHLAGEPVQLVDHRVQRFLQAQDFAAHIDRDLFRQIAVGDRGRDLGDVAHLPRQVRGHRVDAVGQVLPRAGDARHLRLTAEPAFGADLARDARHLAGERVELIDHRVDGLLQLQDLAGNIDRDLLRQIALGNRGRHLGDVAHLARQVRGHRVDRVGQILPGAGDPFHLGLPAELAFGADLARDARHLAGERVELIDHRVDRILQLEDLARDVHRDLLGQVAIGDRGRDGGDVAHLIGQVRGHRVDVLGQVLPGARDAEHVGLPAELAFGADLARDARHFRGEGVELIDHRVDGLFQLQDLAGDVDRDLLRQIAAGDRRRHLGDVADLRRQVRRHRVDVVGQILPGAGDARHLRLPAEPPLGADLARDARHFRREGVELIDHRVDRVLQLEDFARHVDRDLARRDRRARPPSSPRRCCGPGPSGCRPSR